jgi:hypothetical protein
LYLPITAPSLRAVLQSHIPRSQLRCRGPIFHVPQPSRPPQSRPSCMAHSRASVHAGVRPKRGVRVGRETLVRGVDGDRTRTQPQTKYERSVPLPLPRSPTATANANALMPGCILDLRRFSQSSHSCVESVCRQERWGQWQWDAHRPSCTAPCVTRARHGWTECGATRAHHAHLRRRGRGRRAPERRV